MVSTNCRIGIIGAGTSGVYLASLLARQGYQVDLFERSPQPRTDGCGIFLVQSGIKALHQGDRELCQKIINAGAIARHFEFRNLDGKVVNAESVNYRDNELPGILVHRRTILESLLEALPSGCLHLNAEFTDIEQSEAQVTVKFKDGSTWSGDLLVGVDGIVSKVRQYVVPDVQLCYLGDIVWRGILPGNAFCPPESFIVYNRGQGIYTNFFDIGGDRTHWGFFVEREQEEAEKGHLKPSNVALPLEEVAKLPTEARAVIEATPTDQIVCRYSYDIDPIPRFYNNRVVLLGDAAHAKSPTRARGMTSGFEDALALSRYLNSSYTIAEALDGFEAERLPIAHEYQRSSRNLSIKTRPQHKQAA